MRLFKKQRLVILALLLILTMSSGFRCKCTTPMEKKALQPIELNVWGVADDSATFDELIRGYNTVHPNIKIIYKKFRPEEYERMLLEAWAEDRGPDIYAIRNTWLGKYKEKIIPLPDKIDMVYVYEQTIFANKKEQIIEMKPTAIPNIKNLRDNYLQIVYDEIIQPDDQGKIKVWGLPLFVDTLVLYYNQDLLANANIVFPPADWEQFNDQVATLTKFNSQGEIVLPAAGIGTSKNIKYNFDILSALMLQNGTNMIENKKAVFGHSNREGYKPGSIALTFYTDFALPTKQVYTWNESFPLDIDAFRQNQLAFFFGYQQDLDYLKAGLTKTKFAAAPLPQLNAQAPINFANYWLQSVSFKSQHATEAWDFILFMSQKDNLKKYLDLTKRPTPIKSLIEEQKNDLELGAFAQQLLTAQNWYFGKNIEETRGAFADMISEVVAGSIVDSALDRAAQRVGQTF